MSYTYTLNTTVFGQIIVRSDGAFIPIANNNIDYQNYLSWLTAGNTPTIPTPPELTIPQQATAAISAPYIITSPTTLGLSANGIPFAVDTTTQSHINSEISAILLNGNFADGTSTVSWPDLATPVVNHTFTVSQFKIFAGAIGSYVAALYKCINGTLTTLPPANISI